MKRLFLLSLFMCVFFAQNAHAVDIQEVTASKSGLKAWLVEDHKLPIIAMHFAFRGGSEQDPSDKQGLATLTMDLLTEGAGSYDATGFQKELADHSIKLDVSAGRDEIEGGLKCLTTDRQKAFDLLHLALLRPHFDDADIERVRAQQLSSLRQQIANPNWQARYALLTQLFPGHPYSERRLGSTQTLQGITSSDVRDFAAKHLARDNLIIAVAGDITPADLSSLLDKVFEDLPAHAQLTPIPEAQFSSDTPTILVHRDGTQSSVMFAMAGPKRNDADWYAADIANYILGGGGFTSRLMIDVRDKKGLTYGIDTGLAPSDRAGLIIGQASVDNSKVEEALETMRDTMHRFYSDGATAREVMAAKDYLTGSQPLKLTSTDKIADMLVEIQREHLGRDYLDRYDNLIRGVSVKDVNRAINTWFNPDNLTWVMVGSPQNISSTRTQETIRQ